MPKLTPVLGLRSATFLVISVILGSGVFKKVALMSSILHSPTLVLLCWGLAGLVSLAGALCMAEMVGMFPNSGGEYYYFQIAFNRFFAFIYGWANFIVLKTAGIAALAYIFAESFNSIFPLPEWSNQAGRSIHPFLENFSVKLLASLLILGLSYLNYLGIKNAEKLSSIMTILMLAACSIIVIAGFSSHDGNSNNIITPIKTGSVLGGWELIKAITIASLGAFWGYEGWNSVGLIGEEIKNPKRNIPLSLGIGTLIMILLYLLLNLVYFYILPIDVLATISTQPNKIAAVEVMRVVWGKSGALFVALLMLVTTFNSTNGSILTSARLFFAMARDKNFYPKAATIHPVYKTPSTALLLQAIWSVVMVFSGTFDQLTDLMIFASFIFYGSTAVALLFMRLKSPNIQRSYKVIWYPLTPILFTLSCLLLIGVTLFNQPKEALSGLGLIAAGIPFYYFWNRKQ